MYVCFSYLRSHTYRLPDEVTAENTVEEYGAHSMSPTAQPRSKFIMGRIISLSHILIFQSAEQDMKTLGWKVFHLTA